MQSYNSNIIIFISFVLYCTSLVAFDQFFAFFTISLFIAEIGKYHLFCDTKRQVCSSSQKARRLFDTRGDIFFCFYS